MDLDRKIFGLPDQARFARLSGDCNPIHLDPVAARRTEMGAPIVHGIHAVLWALEALCRRGEISALNLQVNFLEPIYVGESAVATLVRRSEAQARINIEVGGTLATAITLGFGGERKFAPGANADRVQTAGWPRFPVELDLEAMKAQAGAISLARSSEALAAAFPSLCRGISPSRVAAMVGLSPLVGMISPGLHSILKSYSLEFVEGDGEEVLRYTTLDVNKRFRLVRMGVGGAGIAGECLAYARMPPVVQPRIADVAASVPAGAYRGASVLVVGGSRGLGEVVAKACAAGGAEVLITYAVGKGDAERVVQEISGHGCVASARSFDIRGDVQAQLKGLPFSPTHLYYFASGPMLKRRRGLFSADTLSGFLGFCADGFFETCNAVLGETPGRKLRIFYPSTLAVTHPTRGSTELAMAKAAGEALCRNMNQYLPGADVFCRRLPRMLTDETATVSPAEALPVLDVMLPVVSEMQMALAERAPICGYALKLANDGQTRPQPE